MDKFVKKLIERLEELTHDNPMVTSNYILRKDAIEIVNQLAEEYSNDWIPCSERLPEWGTTPYLVCLKHGGIFLALYLSSGQFKEISSMGIREFCENNPVIAWQPLPAPYQSKGE